MGSSCSILNDTEYDVWIIHGVNWNVIKYTVVGVAAVLSSAAAVLASLGAGAGVGGTIISGGAMIMAEEGAIMGATVTTFAGLNSTQWSIISIVVDLSAKALSNYLDISKNKAEQLQKRVKDFREKAKLIKPGKSYTWSGSLSLTMTVYVMNEKVQFDQRDCWTGATAESVNEYTISKHFQQLDAKKHK